PSRHVLPSPRRMQATDRVPATSVVASAGTDELTFHEAPIARCEVERGHLLERDPAYLVVLQRFGIAADGDVDEPDDEGRAGVVALEAAVACSDDVAAELLTPLAARSVEQRLAILDLAAREFPQTAVTLVRGTSAQQPPVTATDHGGEDVNDLVGH